MSTAQSKGVRLSNNRSSCEVVISLLQANDHCELNDVEPDLIINSLDSVYY